MKDICVYLVSTIMMIYAFCYVYLIWKREIIPTLSTWIIFLIGTGLSLVTYAIAEEHDFRSGILNTMDVVATAAILMAAIVWGKREMRLKSFEKYYLFGLATIVIYGFISGDAWSSNVFTQMLISIGYIPTVHNLLTEKRNTESIAVWSLGIIAGLLALYPASRDGNFLAMLYAFRSVFFVSIIISIMYLKSNKIVTTRGGV